MKMLQMKMLDILPYLPTQHILDKTKLCQLAASKSRNSMAKGVLAIQIQDNLFVPLISMGVTLPKALGYDCLLK